MNNFNTLSEIIKNKKNELTEKIRKDIADNKITVETLQNANQLYLYDPFCKITRDLLFSLVIKTSSAEYLLHLSELYPDDYQIVLEVGLYLQKIHKYQESTKHFKLAFSLTHDKSLKAVILNQISQNYYNEKNRISSFVYSHKSLEFDPNNLDNHNMLGVLYTLEGDATNAVKHYDKVLRESRNKDQIGTVLMNKGQVLSSICHFKEAKTCYERSLIANPNNHLSLQNMIFDDLYDPDITEKEVYQNHKKIDNMFTIKTNSKNINKDKPVIGIISGDLVSHPVSKFISTIIDDQEIFIFSTGITKDNNRPNTFMIKNLDDKCLYDLIIKCNIDILIDLSVHTGENRIKCLAMKPAPIIVNYLGYCYSSGSNIHDYRLVDSFTDDEETEKYCTEKLVYFSNSFLNFDPSENIKIKLEKKSKTITFISTNRMQKINKKVLNLWKRILDAVPNSIIIIKNKEVKNIINRNFITSIIPENRIVFKDFDIDSTSGMTIYNEADIYLDTFPYAGTCSTCDALSMGMTCITLSGVSHRQNVGKSLLINTGFKDWIANTEDEYVSIAVELSKNLPDKNMVRNTFVNGLVCNKEKWKLDFDKVIGSMLYNHSE